MADLSSIITVSGNVNGRRVQFTHTYTITDVYDVASRASAEGTEASNYMESAGKGGAIGYRQNGPNYLIGKNSSAVQPMLISIFNSTDQVDVVLGANQFFIIAGDDGLFNVTGSTGETSLLEVDRVDALKVPGFSAGVPSVLMAFKAAS